MQAMYEVQILSADDGESVSLPHGTQQYTVLSETDESGNVQVAVLVEHNEPRGVA